MKTNSRIFPIFRRSRRSGVALIMVLSIIVLVTILVVGMTVAMRMERSASHYHLERTRAEILTRNGVDFARALLRGATATNRFWVSAPGRIQASAPGTFGAPTNQIALSSGVTSATNSNIAVDFNRPGWNNGGRVLDPRSQATNLNVAWIYVENDGDYANTTNSEVVGRFAFWVDDDSARVNVNTAGERSTLTGNTQWASPRQITLDVLPGTTSPANLAAITNFTTTNAFRTAFEVLDIEPDLTASRFFITAYSQDPDTDPWGDARLVLTTRTNRASGRAFLDILTNKPITDPGLLSDVDSGKLEDVYTNIVESLVRTNWPYAPGSSFAAKFGVTAAEQLALDIIEYVRTAESTNAWIEPLVANVTTNSLALFPGTTALADPGLTTSTRIGTVRRPMFTQVGVFCSTNTNSTGYIGTLYAQLFLPAGYATNSVNASMYAEIGSNPGGFSNVSMAPITVGTGYTTYTNSNFSIPANPGTSPTNVTIRVALLTTNVPETGNILDIAPLASADHFTWAMGTNQTGSVKINDPRLNKLSANWTTNAVQPGDVPLAAHVPTFAAYPASDGSDLSVYFPAPNSIVGSVGELGHVFSGMPWRSIRLRPGSSANTSIVPDWALLDLFSAPIIAETPALKNRYFPGGNVVAGRININAAIRENTNFSRTNALNALFTNTAVPNVSVAVENVIGGTNLASGGLNYAGTNFLSVGQLAEIAGVADTGGEAGEKVMRQVASLATVRGSVFTIYSVGQALEMLPDGTVKINGEKMVRVTIERYFDGGTVKFRTLGRSQIYP